MKNNKNSTGTRAELSSTAILLEKDPLFIYVLALGAIFLGLSFIIGPVASEGFANSKTLVPQLLMCLLGAGAVTVGIVIFRIGLTEILLDQGNSLIVFRKRFSHKLIAAVEVSNIQELTIDSRTDSEGDRTYRLAFKLKSGELLPLTKTSIGDKEAVQNSKRRIDRLLQLNNSNQLNASSNLTPDKKMEPDTLPLPNFYEQESQRKKNKPLLLTMATFVLITATPFVGLELAKLEKPSTSLIIKAGKPDANALKIIADNKSVILEPEEEILWVGTPEPGREGRAKIWFLPFAIIWTLFSCFWTAIALSSALNQRNFVSIFMVLWGLPFVGIGLTMLSSPYFAYRRELHTIYAITDQRALSINNESTKEVAKFDSKHFGPIKSTNYSNKRMDLLFWSSLDPESSSSDPCAGFWGIEDGPTARSILEAKLAHPRSILNRYRMSK